MNDVHPNARPTIRDVSRLAGVSIKTVSRVINNQQYVSEQKAELVRRVMADVGFQPNQAARALAGHRSHQVAVICDNPNPWYVYELQFGVRERCGREGVRMLAQPYDRASPTLSDDVVALIDQVHPDGLVLAPPACDDERVLAELRRRGTPFVRIQPGVGGGVSPWVDIDNEAAAFDMAEYLLSLGHRRIGFVVGDPDYAVSRQRLAGYRRALARRGVGGDEALVQPGRFDFTSGIDAAQALLALPQRPTAIFASSDDIAAGVLAVAHRGGVRVPDDLTVVGFDDAPIARMVWPPLTTVRQPMRLLAELATDLLLAQPTDPHRRVSHELIVRESSAAPTHG